MNLHKGWVNKLSEGNLKHTIFMEHQHICSLCGTEVHIQILEKNTEYSLLLEQVSCPKCKIKTRTKTHTIQ